MLRTSRGQDASLRARGDDGARLLRRRPVRVVPRHRRWPWALAAAAAGALAGGVTARVLGWLEPPDPPDALDPDDVEAVVDRPAERAHGPG